MPFISKVANCNYITIAIIIVAAVACFITATSRTVLMDDQEAVAGAYLDKKLTKGSDCIVRSESCNCASEIAISASCNY